MSLKRDSLNKKQQNCSLKFQRDLPAKTSFCSCLLTEQLFWENPLAPIKELCKKSYRSIPVKIETKKRFYIRSRTSFIFSFMSCMSHVVVSDHFKHLVHSSLWMQHFLQKKCSWWLWQKKSAIFCVKKLNLHIILITNNNKRSLSSQIWTASRSRAKNEHNA